MMLRRSGVIDEKILAAIERTPRDAFVPTLFRDRAYEDAALPIGNGQTISRPSVVAFMTAMLAPGPRMRVLEIGTGSGYQAAVLTWLCRRVYTIERHRPLLSEAEARFERLGLTNITARCGDGVRGWPRAGQFDRILVTAAADDVPTALVGQLAEGGPDAGADSGSRRRAAAGLPVPDGGRRRGRGLAGDFLRAAGWRL